MEARLILEHVAPNAVPVGTRYVGDAAVCSKNLSGTWNIASISHEAGLLVQKETLDLAAGKAGLFPFHLGGTHDVRVIVERFRRGSIIGNCPRNERTHAYHDSIGCVPQHRPCPPGVTAVRAKHRLPKHRRVRLSDLFVCS